jgi:Cu(I)/Ag(I) efflux system membrane fusion protein
MLAALWVFDSGMGDKVESPDDRSLAWVESGAFEIGVATIPATPRIGKNKLIVKVRLKDGTPAGDARVMAYAEMAAMASMPAMRAPADLVKSGDGQFEGAVDLRMRGAWPLNVTIEDAAHGNAQLVFDLATDRPGLRVASGGHGSGVTRDPGAAQSAEPQFASINVDSHRRQLIGLETSAVTHHDLVKIVRAIGNVTFDERRVTKVTLKYDAWIGDLQANHVGAPVKRGEHLFSVYSPALFAAQEEYLQARKRLSRRDAGDSLLNAARQRLKLWDLTDREIQALEMRDAPAEYVPIYAPFSGIVIDKPIENGSAIKTGQTLLRIADLDRIWIVADIYETDLDLISKGMSATVALPYLPDRSFVAVVDYIYPYLDKASRTGRIRLTLDNADGALRPDMYAEVILRADIGHRLAVPEEAVLFAGDSRIVFVDLGGGQLKPVRIKTGQRAQGMLEVTDGLSNGDVIVTSGNFLIAAETRLKSGIDQW